jgi:protein-L-isoaspartate O-methyltransferase
MGGSVSSGENNEELVDNLVHANYITNPEIEKVFRAVDRGHFFPDDIEVLDLPYQDVAWRAGRIHISAPCIYSEVIYIIEVKLML